MESGKERFTYDAYCEGENGMMLVDFEWRLKHIGHDFVVRYNPDDITKIYLYKEDPNGLRYERTLTPKIEVARAIQDQSEADVKFLRQVERDDRRARLSLEAERNAIIQTWQVGKLSLEPDMVGTSSQERSELAKEVERRKQQKLERNSSKGLVTTPTPEPLVATSQATSLDMGKVYKEESLRTWDDIDIKVVKEEVGGEVLPGFESYRPMSVEEIARQVRSKY